MWVIVFIHFTEASIVCHHLMRRNWQTASFHHSRSCSSLPFYLFRNELWSMFQHLTHTPTNYMSTSRSFLWSVSNKTSNQYNKLWGFFFILVLKQKSIFMKSGSECDHWATVGFVLMSISQTHLPTGPDAGHLEQRAFFYFRDGEKDRRACDYFRSSFEFIPVPPKIRLICRKTC